MNITKEITGESLGFKHQGDALGLGASTFTIYQTEGQVVAVPDKCILAGQSMIDVLESVAHVPTRIMGNTKDDLSFAFRVIGQLTSPNRASNLDHSSISLKKAHETSPHFGAAMQEFLTNNKDPWLASVEYAGIDSPYKRVKGLRVFRSFDDLVELTIEEATSNIMGVEEEDGWFEDRHVPKVRAIGALNHALFDEDRLDHSPVAQEVRRQFICFLNDAPDSKAPDPDHPTSYFYGDLSEAFLSKQTFQRQAELILEFLGGLKEADYSAYQDFALRLGETKKLVLVDLQKQRFYNSLLKAEIGIGPAAVDITPEGEIKIEKTGRPKAMYSVTVDASKVLRGGKPQDWQIADMNCDEAVSNLALVPVIAFDRNGFLNQPDTNEVLQSAGANIKGVPDVFMGRILVESQMPEGEKPLSLLPLPTRGSIARRISARELPIWVSMPARSKMLLESQMVKALAS